MFAHTPMSTWCRIMLAQGKGSTHLSDAAPGCAAALASVSTVLLRLRLLVMMVRQSRDKKGGRLRHGQTNALVRERRRLEPYPFGDWDERGSGCQGLCCGGDHWCWW